MFDNVIFGYSRQQAIEDGVLFDVTETASEAGFVYHTVVTAAVQGAIDEPHGEGDPKGRLWDVLNLARFAVTVSNEAGEKIDRTPFQVKIGRKIHDLIVHVGPGDTMDPVLTIAHPIDL